MRIKKKLPHPLSSELLRSDALLEKREKSVFHQIGIGIAKQPMSFHRLLSRYGIPVDASTKSKELINKLIYAIENRGTAFRLDLAKLIASQKTKNPKVLPSYLRHLTSQDNFFQVNQQDQWGEQEDAYVGLIVGAISGIAEKVGSIKGKSEGELRQVKKCLRVL